MKSEVQDSAAATSAVDGISGRTLCHDMQCAQMKFYQRQRQRIAPGDALIMIGLQARSRQNTVVKESPYRTPTKPECLFMVLLLGSSGLHRTASQGQS